MATASAMTEMETAMGPSVYLSLTAPKRRHRKKARNSAKRRLRQLRRLQRKRTGLKPAVAAGIGDVDRQQQQQHNTEAREREAGIIPLAIIALHAVEEQNDRKHRPAELTEKEIGARHVVFQFRDHRRRTVNHHQPKTNQPQDGKKQDPICFETLRHLGLRAILPLSV